MPSPSSRALCSSVSWPCLPLYFLRWVTLEPHKDGLARCGALCGKGREGRNEVKISWPESPAWQAGLRHGDVIKTSQEEGSELVVSWLRDSVHEHENTIAIPLGSGYFARPSLASFPG